jgi:hypothetical protein
LALLVEESSVDFEEYYLIIVYAADETDFEPEEILAAAEAIEASDIELDEDILVLIV